MVCLILRKARKVLCDASCQRLCNSSALAYWRAAAQPGNEHTGPDVQQCVGCCRGAVLQCKSECTVFPPTLALSTDCCSSGMRGVLPPDLRGLKCTKMTPAACATLQAPQGGPRYPLKGNCISGSRKGPVLDPDMHLFSALLHGTICCGHTPASSQAADAFGCPGPVHACPPGNPLDGGRHGTLASSSQAQGPRLTRFPEPRLVAGSRRPC